MSSRKAGHWISPKGKVHEINEHFSQIIEQPKLFGFTKAEADSWVRADRDRIVTEAVRRGWIRVRGHGTSTTFDVRELTSNVIFDVAKYLDWIGAWENEDVKVHEVLHKKVFDVKAGWFLLGEALKVARNPRKKKVRR